MNYYIQGDAARADQIKAAFEKKGYSDKGFTFDVNDILFFTANNKHINVCPANGWLANIIKTHPDYKELELPVEPKFKEGDWYLCVNDFYGKGVRFDKGNTYHCGKDGCLQQFDSGAHISIVEELYEYFRLWTIADAQDGDVLATDNIICIFRKLDKDGYYIISPCIYTVKDGLEIISDENDTIGSFGFKPATKEDRELLFRKMEEVGYKWDADKKELKKIKPHYNIANFHAGMPVLVRDNNGEEWRHTAFSHMTSRVYENKFAAGCTYWCQCIPFNDDTKHLLGTTDMCDEMYINW